MSLYGEVKALVKKVEAFAIKASAVAATVAGAVTAAYHGLPGYESAILTVAGPVVFLAERYWADVVGEIHDL